MILQDRRIELLQGMPIFGAIREDAIRFLLGHAKAVVVPAGEFFFHENDPAHSMFVLESGRATVIRNWQGRELVLHSFGAGDCFGELALMDLGQRSASVRADDACSAIELGTADLFRLFERDAEQFALIQMNLCREVCRRLRDTDELLFRASMGEPMAASAAPFRSA